MYLHESKQEDAKEFEKLVASTNLSNRVSFSTRTKHGYEGRIAQASILEFALESKVSVLGSCVPRLRVLDQFFSTRPRTVPYSNRSHFISLVSAAFKMSKRSGNNQYGVKKCMA